MWACSCSQVSLRRKLSNGANKHNSEIDGARQEGGPTPHIFLRSVHHTPIERGWLDLRRSLGENFHHFWVRGAEGYKNDAIGKYVNYLPVLFEFHIFSNRVLLRWLWPNIIQRELDKFCVIQNARRVRKQKEKRLPSGVSPEYSYTCPDLFNGHQCLRPVDSALIDELLSDLEDEKEALSDWEVPEEFKEAADTALTICGFEQKSVTVLNAWLVYNAVYPHLIGVDPHVLGLSDEARAL